MLLLGEQKFSLSLPNLPLPILSVGAVTPDMPASHISEPAPPSGPPSLQDPLGLTRREADRKMFHQHLANYFMKTPNSSRRADELPWQLQMCGDLEQLCKIVGDPR